MADLQRSTLSFLPNDTHFLVRGWLRRGKVEALAGNLAHRLLHLQTIVTSSHHGVEHSNFVKLHYDAKLHVWKCSQAKLLL